MIKNFLLTHFKFIDWSKISYVLKGILVGAVAGIVVSAFRMAIYRVLNTMPLIYDYIRSEPSRIIIWVILVLVIAFVVIMIGRDEPDIQGNGVSELKGQLQGTIKLNWFSILWRKFSASTLVLGLGLPVGREGPSIQIGGVVGMGINKFLKGNKSQENILISGGAAAGLSAAFNAPLSGLVIILEEVHHRFSGILILSVFSASVTANYVAFHIFGSNPALDLGRMNVFPLEHYFYLVALGTSLALAGWVFQKVLFNMPRLYARLPIPKYLYGFIPFLIVIPTGLYWEEMLGGGTEIITALSSGRTATSLLLAILVFRFLTFNIAFGSGIPAGVMIPMLSIGAILGGIFGNIALQTTGLDEIFLRSFIIYAMGGFFTSVSKAPLTAIILITEITESISQMMPIAVVCLTAYIVADIIGLEPIDEVTLYNKTSRIPTVFEGKLANIDIFVEPQSYMDGAQLSNLALPYNSKVIRIRRHHNEFIPHRDTVFLAGDELRIACDNGFVKEVNKYIEKVN